MQSRNLLNLALALLVAGLVLFVYLRPAPQVAAQLDISNLDAGQVTHVVIQRPGQAELALQKRAGQWFISAPFRARADNLRVEKILKILSAKSAQSFAATDLARFGLDRPLLQLTIDGQTFAFGTQHPLTNEIYVATQGRVYLLPPSHFASASASAPDFASKMLFAPDENPLGFAFPGFTLTQDQGKWSRRPPGPDLSQDSLNQWADEWRRAIAVIAQPYAQGNPLEQFSVRLSNGKTVPFQILQREPELVLLRGDENMQYHFPNAIGKRLLEPPGQPQARLP
jgi:hypothetical protein